MKKQTSTPKNKNLSHCCQILHIHDRKRKKSKTDTILQQKSTIQYNYTPGMKIQKEKYN